MTILPLYLHEGLIKIMEESVKIDQNLSPNKPIDFLGESFNHVLYRYDSGFGVLGLPVDHIQHFSLLPVVQFAGQHPGGLGVPAVGMAFPGYVTQPNGMGNSEMTWLLILAGAAGAFGCFTLYHNRWCLSCYAIWPDLCIASYKLSWQPLTVVLDRHLLAKDIVYMFFCCYCGFRNIHAYCSNCMYLT
ncbi:unnamed protein product [Lactuca saligna]|uniref:Uncharacterized protein n=1 Tax=Lactuca saligna TaxID=75948 RepID=A0AA35ZQV4_LACSI|nr:unnamed protein product [Lactuca saligna]